MIIYALIISASCFFLAWNLISNRTIHLVTTLITTVLFIIATGFAIANFGFHYGMHQVSEPARSQSIHSLSPLKSLRMIAYRPMGTGRNSQLVIYKNDHQKVVHTNPDVKVKNRIVRSANVDEAHVVTKDLKWKYRNSMTRAWFNLAKKPSVVRVNHVFYVPKSWKILTAKQTLAFKQIIKNRNLQLKRRMKSPKMKLQMKQQASEYVKAKLTAEIQRNHKLTAGKKRQVIKQATKEFEFKSQQKFENQVAVEALRTSQTIH